MVEAPELNLGVVVDVKGYKPRYHDRELVIEIRQLRGSKKYFPHVQLPDNSWTLLFPSRETPKKAFNLGKKCLDFHLEDVSLEEEDNA